MGRIPSLNIVAIGGPHQLPHFLPVGFDLHQRGLADVTVFVSTKKDENAVNVLAERLSVPRPHVEVMEFPGWIENALARWGRPIHKAVRMIAWRNKLRGADGLLSAERTSTLLKRLPGKCPTFVHIPHGAGDRAIGFEKRLSLFDHVITAGEKDRRRMVEDGVVREDHCHVGGPVKVSALIKSRTTVRLFDNDRPTILYNPHFVARLGSFADHAQRLIDEVVADGRYNLAVAPHIRMAEGWSAEQKAAWAAKSVPDRVIVDLGSVRSIDMSYTNAADVYLGDVSSQVYEFLVVPRPCAFINAHGIEWEGDPDYAMWTFGPVADANDPLIDLVDRAIKTHAEYRLTQVQRVADALQINPDDLSVDGTVERVADLVLDLISPSLSTDRSGDEPPRHR